MTSAAMPPGRSSRSVSPSTLTMADSSPTSVGPPSTISEILPPRSASTASAVVEVMRPDELALGAASGRPKRAMSSAPKPCGMRSAIVSRPAVTSGWMPERLASGSTSVSGPGQKASASFSDSGSKTRDLARHRHARDMGDQRIEARPAFCLEDAGDGLAIGRVAGKAVDGLGRDRDDLAGFEQRESLLHRLACLQDFRHCRAFRIHASRVAIARRRWRQQPRVTNLLIAKMLGFPASRRRPAGGRLGAGFGAVGHACSWRFISCWRRSARRKLSASSIESA